MDNIILSRRWVQGTPVTIDNLTGTAFTGEAQAHTFRISGVDAAGADVQITGTVTGAFLAPNNVTIPLEGTLTDGVAEVTLTSQCYELPGRFILSVYAANGDTNLCIYCGVGYVFCTETDQVAYPSAAIPDISQLIQEAQDVIDSIPEDYSALSAHFPATGKFVVGTNTSATEENAVAEGEDTIASGLSSHAEGYASEASGDYSHSEGGSIASGGYSHAEGSASEASGENAHAEGYETTASGDNSHSEGWGATASGMNAHAEGVDTVASGNMSHSEGEGTIANHAAQSVSGTYNVADTSQAAATAKGTYAEIVGNGTADNARSNARTLDWSGNEDLAGDLTINKNGANEMTVGQELSDLKSAVIEEITGNLPTAFHSDYSSAMLNLSGYSGKKVFISNKNLLPQFTSGTNNGVTYTSNADGSLTMSGTATGTSTRNLSVNVVPNLGPGVYTVSMSNTDTVNDDDTYLQLELDGTFSADLIVRLKTTDAKLTFRVEEGHLITAARLRVASGVAFGDGITIYPQIEQGAVKTDFVKHDGYVLSPTVAEFDTTVFVGYNYVCVQSGVTGTVTYKQNKTTAIAEGAELKKFKGKTIVFFGDSLVGNPIPPTDLSSKIAAIIGATVYNVGFGGCCMADNHLVDTSQTRYLFTMCRLADAIAAGDFSAQENSGVTIKYAGTQYNYVPDRINTLKSIDWENVDYIFIYYGTNDWNSNYPLDNQENPLDTTSYIGAFRYAVEKLLTAYPNIKIMPITPCWRYWDTDTGLPSGETGDYLDANTYAKGTGYYLWNYGDALIEAASDYHIPTLDMYHRCMMNKFNRHQYFNVTDGTHPKETGRDLETQIIVAALSSYY